MPYIVHDKKGSSDGVTAVRVSEIGKFEFVKMTNGEIKELLVNNI
jgi:hypothetical protein